MKNDVIKDVDNLFFNSKEYTLTTESLGSGSFGRVFAGKDVNGGKVAIKLLNFGGNFDGDQQMRFLKESMILSLLKHPSIVKFIGINFQAYEDPQDESVHKKRLPSIVTEYLPNGSIEKLLRKLRNSEKVPEWNATLKFILLLGISNAMMYLHKNGILHRDLKPDNILLDENFYPRICDFGLSKMFKKSLTVSQELQMSNVVGSALYMAPEIFLQEYVKYSVDVFSFSIIAYEIISEKFPYTDTENLVQKVIARNYRPSFQNQTLFTEDMQDLLQKCWIRDPELRPSFAEIFQELRNNYEKLSVEKLDAGKIESYIENYCEEPYQNKDCNTYVRMSNLEKVKDDLIEEINELAAKYADIELEATIRSNTSKSYLTALIGLIGDKTRRNPQKSILNLETASDGGNPDASFVLGLLYESGEYCKKSFKKACHYYELSSKQGNSRGFQRIGFLYMMGIGISRPDYKKAKEYYEKAEEMNDTSAMNNLGNMYRDGKIVDDKDRKSGYEKARECFEKAQKLGDLMALNNLGLLYLNGLGVKKDYEKAKEYFEKAAKVDPMALNNLGILYMTGDVKGDTKSVKKGVEKDLKKAREYFEQAVKLGCAPAQEYLNELDK